MNKLNFVNELIRHHVAYIGKKKTPRLCTSFARQSTRTLLQRGIKRIEKLEIFSLKELNSSNSKRKLPNHQIKSIL